MLKNKKKILLFRLCIGLGTFALLFILFDPKEIFATLAKTNSYFFFIAFISYFLVFLGRVYRWSLILKDIGIGVPFLRIAEMYIISYWFNTFTPGSVGGDVYKMYMLFNGGARKIHSLATVLIERLTGVISLITICFVSVLLFIDKFPVPHLIILFLFVVISFIFIFLFSAKYIRNICLAIRKYIKFTQSFLSDTTVDVISVAVDDIRNNKMLFMRAYFLGIILQIMVLVSYYLVGVSLLIDNPAYQVIPFIFFLMFFPVIEIITMVPISINGLGLRELLLVYFIQYANAEGSFAMSFSVINSFMLIIFAITGGILLLLKRNTRNGNVLRSAI